MATMLNSADIPDALSPGAGPDDDNWRILIVDDNPSIHNDFRSVLAGPADSGSELDELGAELFGDAEKSHGPVFQLDSAFQGEEALAKVRQAKEAGLPYSMAFVDVRMPPGWDGVKTTVELLREDENLGIVICSAYSDYSWDDIAAAIGDTDRVLVLKKPFDTIEVRQLAHALRRRWHLSREAALKRAEMQHIVEQQTRELREANRKIVEEAAAKERMQEELRVAHKLEAVGQLSAGVAHEINTPVQFVSDNLTFLKKSWNDTKSVLDMYRALGKSVADADERQSALAEIHQAESDVDLDYLIEEVPQALEDSLEGVRRVGKIVRSLKEFAHPGSDEKTPEDLNAIIERTLTFSQSEYKDVAKIHKSLGELPLVYCQAGDISQVLLNLIVNAAHAIGDAERGGEGAIRISSECEDENTVVLKIVDNGLGIPAEIRERVYDPFFTTKDIGKGTGQGLAIARSIMDEHGGSIGLESEAGVGTTFFLRFPAETKVEDAVE